MPLNKDTDYFYVNIHLTQLKTSSKQLLAGMFKVHERLSRFLIDIIMPNEKEQSSELTSLWARMMGMACTHVKLAG